MRLDCKLKFSKFKFCLNSINKMKIRFIKHNSIKFFKNNFCRKLSSKIIGIQIFLYLLIFKKCDKKLNLDTGIIKINIPDLNEGEIKQIEINQSKSILVIKLNSEIHVLKNSCTYFGETLHNGYVFNNYIKCPLHGSSYDISTGLCEISPGFGDLKKYEIIKEKDKNFVLYYESNEKNFHSKLPIRDTQNPNRYVIIGAGPAGISCAVTLRKAGFTGDIQVISDEPFFPYDRSSLSKELLNDIAKITTNNESFMKKHHINFNANVKVVDLNNEEKSIKLNNGQILGYDKILIATGSSPHIPNIQGYDLNNVYPLRNYLDMIKIKQTALNCNKIVIIGASFIGLEMASTLKKFNPKVNIIVVDSHESVGHRLFDYKIANTIRKLFENQGIKFELNKTVIRLVEKKNTANVEKVELNDQQLLDADMVLFGTGVYPNTEILESVVTMNNSLVKCDRYLNSSDGSIFAAGDIVSYPWYTGDRVSSMHFAQAQQQGAIAALNMLDYKIPYDYLPYFWMNFFDSNLQFVGFFDEYDEVYIVGDLDNFKFNAFYFKDQKVVGFIAMNSPNDANVIYEAMRYGLVSSAGVVKRGEFNLEKLKIQLKKVKNKNNLVSYF